ncbi:Mso1p Ecym_6034 [Eremothecium cymbalariae DBVPG|uniref:Mso1 N-terminal domain-containing protein n=1 Tax=Eremothecium cymbalariae (strain CBS 270.75 / DBVPG 7215 / KCTC 17166 / NRRL Y-17582) TaxID=931890 RepID=G8JUV9_ERECY|nr:hypothetical protein Ecym_6034 [Eremothecium cymbalariae DBVPG\
MATQSRSDIWNKFKSSTKSLSSSLSQLSIKAEKDGDTPTTTLIHRAFVKYYKKQEPFQGYPDWLGHTEDNSDEQTILSANNSSPGQSLGSADSGTRTTAGMAFQKIYNSVQAKKSFGDQTGNNSNSMRYNTVNSRSTGQLSGAGNHGATWGIQRQQTFGNDRSQSADVDNVVTSSQPAESRIQSQLMRERMKRSMTRRGTFEV